MNEIILYQADELPERIEVIVGEETVWLNRQQMASLFGSDVKTIGKHINNVFSEGKLVENSTVVKFATFQNGGVRITERQISLMFKYSMRLNLFQNKLILIKNEI